VRADGALKDGIFTAANVSVFGGRAARHLQSRAARRHKCRAARRLNKLFDRLQRPRSIGQDKRCLPERAQFVAGIVSHI